MRKRADAFDWINSALLLFVSFLCVFPFLYILAVSLSDGTYVAAGKVLFYPKGIHLEAYKYIFSNSRLNVLQGLRNSFLYAGFGTLFAVTLTYITAYALSKRQVRGRYLIMMLFLSAWIFEAGIIPNYLVWSSVGMVNSFWVMIVPSSITTFLLIITRSFIETLPMELEESAVIDGANDYQVMSRIFMPLSKPVIATIAVFYAVAIWNQFLIPLIYLQDKALYPIQLVLYGLIIQPDPTTTNLENAVRNGHLLLPRNLQAAAIFTAVLPILFIYPIAQKYFTKGFMIGAIKG
ncbi:carbohydrate ABC transporter permease [Cohnella cellulosilytica]|uniref:Carbohydrate ABC transporter permease n=1 Tax=Cohnella cellulosilytica TaxID=986710 RepID=A0ABW2F5G0_9BACL